MLAAETGITCSCIAVKDDDNEKNGISSPKFNFSPSSFSGIQKSAVSAAKVMTTTRTLRRVCGFALALVGFVFFCLRFLVASWFLVSFFLLTDQSRNSGNTSYISALALETVTCTVGFLQFWWIVSEPTFTLKDSNFRNVCPLALIPAISFVKGRLFSSRSYLFLAVFEASFYSIYIYGLSVNGLSNSMWAGMKPYRYEMIPLMLSVPPSSRAFPQYTVPTQTLHDTDTTNKSYSY